MSQVETTEDRLEREAAESTAKFSTKPPAPRKGETAKAAVPHTGGLFKIPVDMMDMASVKAVRPQNVNLLQIRGLKATLSSNNADLRESARGKLHELSVSKSTTKEIRDAAGVALKSSPQSESAAEVYRGAGTSAGTATSKSAETRRKMAETKDVGKPSGEGSEGEEEPSSEEAETEDVDKPLREEFEPDVMDVPSLPRYPMWVYDAGRAVTDDTELVGEGQYGLKIDGGKGKEADRRGEVAELKKR